MENNFITTIEVIASSSFVEFKHTYTGGENYDIQNPSTIKYSLFCLCLDN